MCVCVCNNPNKYSGSSSQLDEDRHISRCATEIQIQMVDLDISRYPDLDLDMYLTLSRHSSLDTYSLLKYPFGGVRGKSNQDTTIAESTALHAKKKAVGKAMKMEKKYRRKYQQRKALADAGKVESRVIPAGGEEDRRNRKLRK